MTTEHTEVSQPATGGSELPHLNGAYRDGSDLLATQTQRQTRTDFVCLTVSQPPIKSCVAATDFIWMLI